MKSTALYQSFLKKLCQIYEVFFGCAWIGVCILEYQNIPAYIYYVHMHYAGTMLLINVMKVPIFIYENYLHYVSRERLCVFFFTILLFKFALKGNIISIYKATMKGFLLLHLPFVISV